MNIEVSSAKLLWMTYAQAYVVHYTADGERLTGQLVVQPVDIGASFDNAFEWYLAHQYKMREELLVNVREEFEKNLTDRFGRSVTTIRDEMRQATIDHFYPKEVVAEPIVSPDSDTPSTPIEATT